VFEPIVEVIPPVAFFRRKHWGYAAVWQLLKPLMFWNKDIAKAEVKQD
jgi:hypothetical protein